MYWRPIALALKKAGFFVSVVNAMLIHDFSDSTIRKLKEGFPTIPCYGEGFKMRCFGFDKFNNRLLYGF